MGATWLRAEGGRHRCHTVVDFVAGHRLKKWQESPERTEWIGWLNGITGSADMPRPGWRPGSARPGTGSGGHSQSRSLNSTYSPTLMETMMRVPAMKPAGCP
jgi:uncharacterized protein